MQMPHGPPPIGPHNGMPMGPHNGMAMGMMRFMPPPQFVRPPPPGLVYPGNPQFPVSFFSFLGENKNVSIGVFYLSIVFCSSFAKI